MPSYQYAIVGARPEDNLEAVVDAYPAYREKIATLWPELAKATLRLVPAGQAAASGEIPITITDDITDAQALAFHTRTMFGAVSCVVERAMCAKYGLALGPELIHEMNESGINPELSNYVTVPLVAVPGAAPVMTKVPLEIIDPVTSGIVMVNGVAFCNATGPTFWLMPAQASAAYDLAGEATAPLPKIPHNGAIDTCDGTLIWGESMTPDRLAYMREKRGRRWAIANGMVGLGALMRRLA